MLNYISGESKVSSGLIIKPLTKKFFTPPRVILTTHAYFKKRGESIFIYAFHLYLIWLTFEYKVSIHLIVDETHLFLDSLNWSLKLGGLYKSQMSMGGSPFMVPVTHVKNLANLDDDTLNTFQQSKTKHIFYLDNHYSKNPIIGWDRGVFPGQDQYNYPDAFNAPFDLKVHYLNTYYEFLKNKSFNIDNLFSFGFVFTIGQHKGFEREYIKFFFFFFSIQVLSFADYTYNAALNYLVQATSYFVRCKESGEVAYDGEPMKRFISGFDYFSIVILLSIFDDIELMSATYVDYHYDIFNVFSEINIDRINLDQEISSYKNDFGVVILTTKNMTSTLLDSISSELEPVLHFSTNKNAHAKLAESCYLDDNVRLKFMKINQKYSFDIENEMVYDFNMSQNPTPKNIMLSYLNSSISTSIDLPNLNVCSVDLKYTIPFTFVPFSQIKK